MSDGDTTWNDVVQSERYQNLSPEQRIKVADSFFATRVGPKLSDDQIEEGRDKFYQGVIQSDPKITEADIGEIGSPSLANYLKSPRGARLATEVVGGLAGGGAGRLAMRSRGPLMRFIGETTGVAGGSAGGAGVAETFDPTEDPLKTAGEAAVFGTVGEVGGRLAGRMILGPQASRSVVPGGRAAVRQLGERATPTPGQLSENAIIDMTEQVAEGSILGGKALLKTREKAAQVAQGDIRQFVDGLTEGMSREQSGKLAQEAIENRVNVFRATAQGLFRKVDSLVENVEVPTDAIRKRALELRREAEKGLKGQAGTATRLLDDVLERTEGRLTFEEAQAIRSDLLAIGRTDDPISGKAEAYAKQLAKAVDGSMSSAADDLSPEGLRAFRRANSYYKKGAETFNDEVIKRISRSNPEEVGRILSQADKPTTISRVKTALKKDKRSWDRVRGNVVSRWLRKSINPETGEASAKNFLNQIKNYGDDSLNQLLSKEEQFTLRRFSRTLSIAQSKASEVGGFDVAIKLMQGSAAGGLLFYGDSPGGAAGILLGPTALAKIMSRPKVVRRLTTGLKAPPGSREARRVFTQLSSMLADTPEVQIFNDVPTEQLLENTVPWSRKEEIMTEPQGAS